MGLSESGFLFLLLFFQGHEDRITGPRKSLNILLTLTVLFFLTSYGSLGSPELVCGVPRETRNCTEYLSFDIRWRMQSIYSYWTGRLFYETAGFTRRSQIPSLLSMLSRLVQAHDAWEMKSNWWIAECTYQGTQIKALLLTSELCTCNGSKSYEWADINGRL